MALVIVVVLLVSVSGSSSLTSSRSYKAGYAEGKQMISQKSIPKWGNTYESSFKGDCHAYADEANDSEIDPPGYGHTWDNWNSNYYYQGCMAPYYSYENS